MLVKLESLTKSYRASEVETTAKGYASLNAARAHVAHDLAADIVSLLGSSDVEPGEIAVLVRYNRQHALRIRDALGHGLEWFNVWHSPNTVFDVDAQVTSQPGRVSEEHLRRLRNLRKNNRTKPGRMWRSRK